MRVFDDALFLFSRENFDISKRLHVRFIGESGIDDGGIRREFFRLIIKETLRSSPFAGWPSNVIPIRSNNVTLNHYFQIWRILCASIIHGGEAPPCFSRGIAEFIIFNEIKTSPCIEDVPDNAIWQSLRKVVLSSEEELSGLLATDEFIFRYSCGYSRPNYLVDKEFLIRAVWFHYLHDVLISELEQLRSGFIQTLLIADVIKEYPDEILQLLLPCPVELNTTLIVDLFEVAYSIQTSRRRNEEDVMFYWFQYLTDFE
jgi:hypothetical protein